MLKDFESMNDNQLIEYITMLTNKIGMLSRLSSGSGGVEVLNNMLNLARANMNDRYAKKSFDMMVKAQKPTIESDPELGKKDDENEPEKVKKQPVLNRVTARRADRPSSAFDMSPTPDKKDT